MGKVALMRASLAESYARTVRFALLLSCAAAVLAACGKQPTLSRLPSDATILAFGDSLTFGTGAKDDESYPSRLAPLVGRRVVHAGVPGDITAGALARLPAALEEHSPRLLLLCIGGNDFLRRLSKEQAAANVRAMVKLARSKGVQVVLIGTPEPGFGLSTPAFYGEIAKEFQLPYDGDTIAEVLKDRSLKSDLVHPNARGYQVIAERLAGLLKKTGAI